MTAPAAHWDTTHIWGALQTGWKPRQVRTAMTAGITGDAATTMTAAELSSAGLGTPFTPSDVPADTIVVGPFDPAYPTRLFDLTAWPVLLYITGSVDTANDGGIAIIGTRKPTRTGLRAAETAADIAVTVGAAVHSGAARGCDEHGMQAALDRGGIVTAWVPVYSAAAATKKLCRNVLEAGGAIISEVGPDTVEPTPATLFSRNRLIVAAANLVVVCEGTTNSGTAGAVRDSIDLDRTIICPKPTTSHPDDLLTVLTDKRTVDADKLGLNERQRQRMLGRAPVAAGGKNPRELTELIDLAWKFRSSHAA